MARRSGHEIAADLTARAEKMRADADRGLAVASDPLCSMLWDCEKVTRDLVAYSAQCVEGPYLEIAERFRKDREARWASIRATGTQ